MKPVADQFLLGFFVLSLVGALGWLTQVRRRPGRAVGLFLAFTGMAIMIWYYRAGDNTPMAIFGGVLVFIGVLTDAANKMGKKT